MITRPIRLREPTIRPATTAPEPRQEPDTKREQIEQLAMLRRDVRRLRIALGDPMLYPSDRYPLWKTLEVAEAVYAEAKDALRRGEPHAPVQTADR